MALSSQLGHPPPVGRVSGARSDHTRLEHLAHPVAIEQQGETGDVVLVRMSHHHNVEAAIPDRDALVEHGQEAVRVGPGVDQHPPAARAFEEDRVALPHVEHGQV